MILWNKVCIFKLFLCQKIFEKKLPKSLNCSIKIVEKDSVKTSNDFSSKPMGLLSWSLPKMPEFFIQMDNKVQRRLKDVQKGALMTTKDGSRVLMMSKMVLKPTKLVKKIFFCSKSLVNTPKTNVTAIPSSILHKQ